MMMTYPFDATIFENKLRGFRDSKESFFKFLVENNITIKKEQIREAYIRYYSILPKKAKTAEYISENEGYTFCKQGRGASKVYTVELISR